jgi:outer membrane murein-binding lipoprotein Lpp
MSRRSFLNFLPAAVAAALLLAGCSGTRRADEISRERAIELAQAQVSFQPLSVEAERAVEEGHRVWRVTLRGRDIGPGRPIGEIAIVILDRRTGEIVSLARP